MSSTRRVARLRLATRLFSQPRDAGASRATPGKGGRIVHMVPGRARLARRAVLRGLGATVALPFLEAMVPAFARAAQVRAASPTRMAFVYVPNGIIMDQWTPGDGEGILPLPQELPRILQPVAAFGLMALLIAADGHRFSSLVLGVVQSEPFRMRRGEEHAP